MLYQDHCSRLLLLVIGNEQIIFYSLILIYNTKKGLSTGILLLESRKCLEGKIRLCLLCCQD